MRHSEARRDTSVRTPPVRDRDACVVPTIEQPAPPAGERPVLTNHSNMQSAESRVLYSAVSGKSLIAICLELLEILDALYEEGLSLRSMLSVMRQQDTLEGVV